MNPPSEGSTGEARSPRPDAAGGPSAAPAPVGAAGSSRRGPLARIGAWYRRHVWAATALAVLVVLAAGFLVVQLAVGGRIGDGVHVAGVSVAGLTRAQAQAALARELLPRVRDVQLTARDGKKYVVTIEQLGVTVDTTATAQAAWTRGRHHVPPVGTVWLPGGGGEVAPVVRLDPAAFKNGLESVAAVVDEPARDARLKLGTSSVAVVSARDGSAVDAPALARSVSAAVAAGKAFSGAIPMKAVAPQVSTAEARARAGAAALYLSRPITLRYRDHEVVLTPELMAGMLSVNRGSSADEYPLTFRNAHAKETLHRLFRFAETPARDARVIVHKEGGITVVPSRDGDVLDMDVLLQDLDAAAVSGGLRTVFVALTTAIPRLTTDDVQTMGLASLGSQFVTYYDPRNTSRAQNIGVAAKLVDGTIVQPGSVFSLNGTMGPRTTNRGFDYAPVIASDNVLRQGVGGGICQYATTLFNAALVAGLPIVEREAHSLYISHYPIGRDATVSWGSADFKFRNDTAKPLMIRSWVEGDHLTVAIVGKTGREATFKTSSFYDVRKPAYGKSHPRVIYDSDLGPGVTRWERGIDGRSVRVQRTVRDVHTGKVLFRDTFVSHYQPLDWIKRVGT
jgi:vancomycin resistance protein YoaR